MFSHWGEILTHSVEDTRLVSHPLVCICLLTKAAELLAISWASGPICIMSAIVDQCDFCGMSRPLIFLPSGKI